MASGKAIHHIADESIVTYYGEKNTSFLTSGSNPYAFRWGKMVLVAGWFQVKTVPTQATDVLVTYSSLIFRGNYIVIMYDQTAGDFCTTYISINTNYIRKGDWDFTGRQNHVLNFIGVTMADTV